MLVKIENREIMTESEMKIKYATKWFSYNIVGNINYINPSENKGYVTYIADTDDEIYSIEDKERNKEYGGITFGNDVIFPLEVGGVHYYD